jgi:hypothetical protein
VVVDTDVMVVVVVDVDVTVANCGRKCTNTFWAFWDNDPSEDSAKPFALLPFWTLTHDKPTLVLTFSDTEPQICDALVFALPLAVDVITL